MPYSRYKSLVHYERLYVFNSKPFSKYSPYWSYFSDLNIISMVDKLAKYWLVIFFSGWNDFSKLRAVVGYQSLSHTWDSCWAGYKGILTNINNTPKYTDEI